MPHPFMFHRFRRNEDAHNPEPGHREHHHGPPWAHTHPWQHWFGGRGGPRRPGGFGGPWGDAPWGDDDGPRRRFRRGDIRYALLALLAEQPRHGYELIKELEQRHGGFYRPSPGSVYPTLQMLEDAGHVVSEAIDGKRVYTITDSGRQILAARHASAPGEAAEELRETMDAGAPARQALRTRTTALLGSIEEVARHGTSEQIEAIAQLLDQARRDIYRTLAGTEGESEA